MRIWFIALGVSCLCCAGNPDPGPTGGGSGQAGGSATGGGTSSSGGGSGQAGGSATGGGTSTTGGGSGGAGGGSMLDAGTGSTRTVYVIGGQDMRHLVSFD